MPAFRRPSPEERYLQKKREELAGLEAQLAERELELHTLRGGLISFEAQYDKVVSAKYAQLDELRLRIAELSPTEPPQSAAGRTEQPPRPQRFPESSKSSSSARRRHKSKPKPIPP